MQRFVVLDRARDGSVLRSGVVEGDRSGGIVIVRWNEASGPEELRFDKSRHSRVVEGSLTHAALTDLTSLNARLVDDPVGVFVDRIRERSTPATAKELRSDLENLRLDETLVSEGWKKASRKLTTHAEVRVSGTGLKRTFEWKPVDALPASISEGPTIGGPEPEATDAALDNVLRDGATVRDLAGFFEPAPREAPISEQGTPYPAPDSRLRLPRYPDESGAKQMTVVPLKSSDPVAVTEPTTKLIDLAAYVDAIARGEAGAPVEEVMGLPRSRSFPPVGFLAVAMLHGIESAKDDIGLVARSPLRSGLFLTSLQDRTLGRLREVAEMNKESELLLALACVGRSSASLKDLDLGAVEIGHVVRAAQRAEQELAATRDAKGDGAAQSIRRLASTTLRGTRGEPLPLNLLLTLGRMLLGVGPTGGTSNRETIVTIVDQISYAVRTLPAERDLSPDQLRDIEEILDVLPFQMSGGRSGLLAVLARRYPDALAGARWWTGLTVEHLAREANGDLSRAFLNPAIGTAIVAPLASHHVADATSRRQLAWVLESPPWVTDHVEPATIAGAFSRARKADPWFDDVMTLLERRAWIYQLEERIRGLESNVATAVEEARRSEREANAAAEMTERMREKLEAAQSELRQVHREDDRVRAAQDRQLQIDAMRTVAAVATTVDAALDQLGPDQIRKRLIAALERADVEPLGVIGQSAPFDPVLHDATSRDLEIEEEVEILRVGWSWHSEGEPPLVLQRALVARKATKE